MRIHTSQIKSLIIASSISLVPLAVVADPIKIENPFNADSIPELIHLIVDDIFLPIGAVVCALMIMYAGFLFVTAKGNTGQITKAREALVDACIGSAILLGAWVISSAIQATIDSLRA